MGERILGIDVGAVSISLAEVDEAGRILRATSRAHEGEVEKAYAACRAALGDDLPARLVATRSTPRAMGAGHRVDNLVAAVRAAQALHPELGALLLVGGERFSLSVFSPEGAYLESRFNTLCAAGTGSFLDQQARRLGLADSAELAETALRSDGERPRIATRCAVFAKTDLIHAQQEGYTLEAICDGLCRGLAANVHDALFSGQPPASPVVFAGGVARNRAVADHLADLAGLELTIDEHASVYGAYGAALDWLEAVRRGAREGASAAGRIRAVDDDGRQRTHFAPLELRLSRYPDFDGLEHNLYAPTKVEVPGPVEVDVYRSLPAGERIGATLGLDIGSTSTKAILLGTGAAAPTDGDEGVPALAGFYTRTAGRPLKAVQAIFEAIWDWARRSGAELDIVAAGTTGSGRKFIGALVGADLVLDEITAHARAAVELDPEVDTIIEIGGQDAKFTTLSHGTVTQSIMNHVCAAGTGSFIEEQAQRLGCPLSDMADRTDGQRAPLASDRCTVFMERDINHFLSDGFAVDEVLCATLHAVRDNYLLKVAQEGSIGERICFQGATAKNRSLVAAFEQKLDRPIQVSRYCHLTGALGVALELRARADAGAESTFRGLDLYAEPIPVETQVCELCHNNCKLRLAEVRGERVGFGYLCGRDPDEERFVSADKSGFDLLRARAKHFKVSAGEKRTDVVIGLPAALHMVEDLPLWKKFFAELGVRTLTSEKLAEPVAKGKRLASAEFCAPVAAWHAHVASLAERADFIFAPHYIEHERPRGERRLYCYYTQYAATLIDSMAIPGLIDKCLMPPVHLGQRSLSPGALLHQALESALGPQLKKAELAKAFERASAWFEQRKATWPDVMKAALPDDEDLVVVLLGRPYTVLAPRMNKAVPEILGKLGIKAFYQDMLAVDDLGEAEGLVRGAKWIQSQRLLAAAEAVGRTPGLYPVLLTSFKCTPDACTLEYFRRVMDAHGKPFLILQLDEHDSQVGYETRIEAAVRAFENHRAGSRAPADRRRLPIQPERAHDLDGRTLFKPAWDTLASPLLVAGLRRVGVDAHLLDEDPDLIQQSLGLNTGQCIPLSVIVHEYVTQVGRLGLDPARTALWMPDSNLGCNICFFSEYAKGLLQTIGGGFEDSLVYAGEISSTDFGSRAALNTYFAYLFGGMLRRMQTRVRPYELVAGQTDQATAEGLDTFTRAIMGELPKRKAVREVVERFLDIAVDGEPRQQVAIFGDLYVRDNDVFNQDLIRTIEAHGGEVVTTPYTDYCNLIAIPYLRKWLREGLYSDVLKTAPFALSLDLLERPFRREFQRVLGERPVVAPQGRRDDILAKFHVSPYHFGESFENLLKIFHLVERYPDLSLFVQTNPAFCCPSLVTEAMAGRIEQATGIPVVTITYDGTAAPKNDVVIPYLELGRGASGRARPRADRVGTAGS